MEVLPGILVLILSSLGGGGAQDALPDGPIYAILGSNATFKTNLGTNQSFLTLTWTFNGGLDLVPVASLAGTTEHVDEDYVGRVWLNHTTGVLTLGPVKTSDNGDYSITTMDSEAIAMTGETELRVLVPVSKVEIKANIAEAVAPNSTVVLTCSALGSFLAFTWTNGTLPLVADGKHITILNDKTQSSVTIASVLQWELSGPIYCTASNHLERKRSAPFNMTVYYGPEAVLMQATPLLGAAGAVLSATTVNLSCSSPSLPPAILTWYYNGTLVPGKTGPSLVLSDLTTKQGGKYHCSAHNAKTLRTAAALPISISVLELIKGVKIAGPKKQVLAGAAMVNLTCSADSGTVSAASWLKDGGAVKASERLVLSSDGRLLTFKTLQKGDAGQYSCQLSNALSRETISYKMVVFYGPDGVAVSGDAAVEVRDPVTLTCSAESFPAAAFQWHFNGTMLPTKTAQLSITAAGYKDAGMYTCEAANASTNRTVSATFQLAVKEEGALDEALSGGAIAGIVIGVLLALVLAIVGVIYFRRRQTIESPY